MIKSLVRNYIQCLTEAFGSPELYGPIQRNAPEFVLDSSFVAKRFIPYDLGLLWVELCPLTISYIEILTLECNLIWR